jgi:prepilin-type N-terminal cleavage/methylation domain-containing protein
MKKFTLLELLIVIAIIGILVSLLMPSLKSAREKAKIGVCLSNLSQMNRGCLLYLNSNNLTFPIINGQTSNTGYIYGGKRGWKTRFFGQKVKQRPLNIYLGYTQNGIETPILECPSDIKRAPYMRNGSHYDQVGSSYMGAARKEHGNDLDKNVYTNPSTKGLTVHQVKSHSSMVFAAEPGAWHWAKAPNWNPQRFRWHSELPSWTFSFIDGHAIYRRISTGDGINKNRDILDFTNQ